MVNDFNIIKLHLLGMAKDNEVCQSSEDTV